MMNVKFTPLSFGGSPTFHRTMMTTRLNERLILGTVDVGPHPFGWKPHDATSYLQNKREFESTLTLRLRFK